MYRNEGHDPELHQRKKKKKAGGGAMFDPYASEPCQRFNQSYMAQSEEPDRKRARFSKVDGEFLAKIRIESVPAGNQRSLSCPRV